MVIYPSTTLNRVAPVESGMRVAAVGWARSYVRSAENREILFDLETLRRDLFTREGKTGAFDFLAKCSANLLRLWAEDGDVWSGCRWSSRGMTMTTSEPLHLGVKGKQV